MHRRVTPMQITEKIYLDVYVHRGADRVLGLCSRDNRRLETRKPPGTGTESAVDMNARPNSLKILGSAGSQNSMVTDAAHQHIDSHSEELGPQRWFVASNLVGVPS